MLDKEIKESLLSRLNLAPTPYEKIDLLLVYCEELERGIDKLVKVQETTNKALEAAQTLAIAMRKTDDLLIGRVFNLQNEVDRLNINCTIGEKDTIVEARLKTFLDGHVFMMKECENSLKRHTRLLKDLEKLEKQMLKLRMDSIKNKNI